MYRRMLVLLDGSELSEVVFKYAQVLSGRLGMDLELLHVASPQEAEQMPMRRVYIEHMAASLCARAEEIRSSSGAEAIGQCIMARGSVAVGDATEEILKYLKSNQIDLVMMATRGRSGVRGPGLGGVARVRGNNPNPCDLGKRCSMSQDRDDKRLEGRAGATHE